MAFTSGARPASTGRHDTRTNKAAKGLRAGILLSATLFTCALACGAGAPAASAADPTENIPLGAGPAACAIETSTECENWFIGRLDAARADLALSSYALPSDFTSLSADKQLLILSDLDRAAYGYPLIYGLNTALDEAASSGVRNEQDPRPPRTEGPWMGFGSDWADTGPLLAYYLWMYDDGPGSPNVDCAFPGASGCWGHRHVILGEGLGLPQPIVLGVATGHAANGEPGTTLLVSSHPGAATYYTWAQAQSEGAGGSGLHEAEERRKAEEEKHKSEELERRKAEEEKHKSEELERRKAEEEKRQAEEAGERQRAEEQQRKAEEEKRNSEEAQRRKAEEEQRRKAEEEQRRKAEEEKRKAEEEKRKAEQEHHHESPTCSKIIGRGRLGASGHETLALVDELSTQHGARERFEAWVRLGPWQLMHVTSVASIKCAQVTGGHEFKGTGAARLAGATGYTVSFSFVVVGSTKTLSVELGKGGTLVYRASHVALAAGGVEQIS